MSGPAQVFRKHRLLWTFSSSAISLSSSPQSQGFRLDQFSQIQGSCWQCGQEPSPQVYCCRMKPESMTLLCNRKQGAPQSPDRLCWPMTWWNTGSKPSLTGTFKMELQQLELFILLPDWDLNLSFVPSTWLNCWSMPRFWQLYPGPGSAEALTWAGVQS